MSYNIDNNIIRKKTKQISVGNVKIGGDALISIQSMTNTITEDVDATVNQIKSLEDEGADIVRVSCPNEESTKALNKIVNNVNVPIVADIHFHYKRALEAADAGAACLRVNPGNIGPERIKEVIAAAKANSISMRIGVNAGSLGKKIMEKYKEPGAEALVDSALENIKLLESNNFDNFKISVKASNVHTMVAAYEKLSALTDYPLHLGLTEAGTYISGSIKSSMSIGKLLSQGIGDTVRVSLTADPVEEIKIGYEILKSLDLRSRGVKIISCPSCARQAFPVIETVKTLEQRLSHIKQSITVSIIGCIVNGPGEALNSDIGVTGGGKGSNMLYLSGVTDHKISNEDIVTKVVKLVEERISKIND
ncbi:flavodoxin-dependent (E)-4-hydroxy-3-methylbut-2-enyl-diphosphate synthase [Pelagibacteraceae bacterium]|jgi:(E)-4-hydroxy-3-methylbut-2-enyl-diphosphate synthase|nr:flavodoxin-dependent (E)-4-hydroxy-3-methylbut-2-enyl-diphosphate synthase [Pelagibacteraceae bacterium]|tara:strand:+ start:785 stop:1876 length:1092 start_codon:yes stop_codon:yes gene_type:complete